MLTAFPPLDRHYRGVCMRDTKESRVPRRSGEAGLYEVPRWEELVDDPRKAGVLDARTARIVAAKTLGLFAATLGRLFEVADATASGHEPTGNGRDGLDLSDFIPIEELARVLGKDRAAILRKARDWPFVIRVSRKNYVCSKSGFRRWLASRPQPRNCRSSAQGSREKAL